MSLTRLFLTSLAGFTLLLGLGACIDDDVSLGSDPTGAEGGAGATDGTATGGRATGGSATGGRATGGTDPGDPTPGACKVGGCSGQLCVEPDDEGVSTCEWLEAYACYADATCERQADGVCAWTPTAELEACLGDPGGEPMDPCAALACPPTRVCVAVGGQARCELVESGLTCASVLCIEGTVCIEQETCDASGGQRRLGDAVRFAVRH